MKIYRLYSTLLETTQPQYTITRAGWVLAAISPPSRPTICGLLSLREVWEAGRSGRRGGWGEGLVVGKET